MVGLPVSVGPGGLGRAGPSLASCGLSDEEAAIPAHEAPAPNAAAAAPLSHQGGWREHARYLQMHPSPPPRTVTWSPCSESSDSESSRESSASESESGMERSSDSSESEGAEA